MANPDEVATVTAGGSIFTNWSTKRSEQAETLLQHLHRRGFDVLAAGFPSDRWRHHDRRLLTQPKSRAGATEQGRVALAAASSLKKAEG